MALKNLFDMVKADRYTQDGREAIIKAQEEETEDKVYNIGDISQKTGLMKTANGWVKPPKGKQPGKTDKPNPNGVVAQQKQKLEAEKYEAARRDAQAPSKKTEVNAPGLRKDVQEAIKRSSPEEIKAYIKELRTPGSRMSRYFDNPDLLANVYEDELNKMTESKPAAEKPQNSHPMVGQRFDPKQKETEMKWADGQTHTTYSMKDGVGNREEGTRRALVVRENEYGQGVYGVINYDKLSGKINYMKEYDDESEADRAFDTLMAQSKKHLHDSAPRVLTGDTRIRVRKA